MGGRQVVRPRTLDPVSKVRILPAQPNFDSSRYFEHRSPVAPFTSERRAAFYDVEFTREEFPMMTPVNFSCWNREHLARG